MKLSGGYWIIKENAPRDYTIMLDTYTIDLPDFLEKYNSNEEEIKIGLNIQKIFDAINDKDYKYVYKKLDNVFKQNNFPTEESFATYAEKIFTGQSLTHDKCKKSGEIYIYDVSIKQENNNILNKTFIMKLLEGTDFVFSFNIQ